jgi:hypothetical protein
MWYKFPIYSNNHDLVVQLGQYETQRWYEYVTVFCARDTEQRLVSMEICLYEHPTISLDTVKQQIYGRENATLYQGILLIRFRRDKIRKLGYGFGRVGRLGIDKVGRLSVVHVRWIEQGASVEYVNAGSALQGLEYRSWPGDKAMPFDYNMH